MLLHVSGEVAQVPIDQHVVMKSVITWRITATFRARGPSVGEVTIQELTQFERFSTLDGTPHAVEGIKKYQINPREPVNREDAGFTLARTGERLVLL